MLDEDDPRQVVGIGQEAQLVDDPRLLELRLGVARQAGRAAGKSDTVVPRELQAVLHEVVEMLPDTAVGAVERRGMDALAVVGEPGLIGGFGFHGFRGGPQFRSSAPVSRARASVTNVRSMRSHSAARSGPGAIRRHAFCIVP